MRMPTHQISVNRCYQTGNGELRRVTAITITGNVIFTSYRGGSIKEPLVEGEQMPGELFSQDIERGK